VGAVLLERDAAIATITERLVDAAARRGALFLVGDERGVMGKAASCGVVATRVAERGVSVEIFTGDACYDVLAPGTEPARIRVNVVRFAPGARHAWHVHTNGQTFHVTEGLGYVQARGGEIVRIAQGDTIDAPPGQWHWRGATREHLMTHLAIWQGVAEGDGLQTEWGNLVTAAKYPR